MVLSMLNSQQTDTALAGDERDKLINEVIDQINAEFTPAVLSRPSADDKAKVEERVVTQVAAAYRRRSLRPSRASCRKAGSERCAGSCKAEMQRSDRPFRWSSRL